VWCLRSSPTGAEAPTVSRTRPVPWTAFRARGTRAGSVRDVGGRHGERGEHEWDEPQSLVSAADDHDEGRHRQQAGQQNIRPRPA